MKHMIDRSPIGLVSILMGIAVVEGPDGLTRFLAVGEPLHAGDTVWVPGEGEVEIRFGDDSRTTVASGGELYLDPERWRAADMPLDPERQRVLDIRDVLPDAQEGADLRAFLMPEGGGAGAAADASLGDFPLNHVDPDLPGWYLGAGALFTVQLGVDDVQDTDLPVM